MERHAHVMGGGGLGTPGRTAERMLTCLISHSSCLSVLVVFAEACRVTDQPSLFSPATQAPVSRGYDVDNGVTGRAHARPSRAERRTRPRHAMVPRSDPAIPIGAAAAVAEVVAEAAPSEGWRLVDPDRPGHAARVSTGPAPPRSGNGAQTSSRARGAAHHTAIVITYFAHRTERTTSVAPPAPSPGADPTYMPCFGTK